MPPVPAGQALMAIVATVNRSGCDGQPTPAAPPEVIRPTSAAAHRRTPPGHATAPPPWLVADLIQPTAPLRMLTS
jgi:hypothetical protein